MDSVARKQLLARVRHALRWDELSPAVRKTLVAIVGGSVLLAGLAMTFLPGPAFVVIPLGLAILATEFAWARHYLRKARGWVDHARERFLRKKRQRRATSAP